MRSTPSSVSHSTRPSIEHCHRTRRHRQAAEDRAAGPRRRDRRRMQCRHIARASPMIFRSRSAASSAAVRPRSSVRISSLCWPSVGAGRRCTASASPGSRNGNVTCTDSPATGCDPLEEAPGVQLVEAELLRRVHDAAPRARRPATAASTTSAAVALAHHAASSSIELVVVRPCRPAAVASSGRAAHAGSPSAPTQRRPLLVGGDGDRRPSGAGRRSSSRSAHR